MPPDAYDLFFVCARADVPFVQKEVVPRLGVAAERLLLLGDFTPGAAITAEIERGVSRSRFTVVVMSPAFLTDRWAAFGEQLASYSNSIKGRLLPLIIAKCDIPTRLEYLVALDFSDPAARDGEAARLRRLLWPEQPEPARLPESPLPLPPRRRPWIVGAVLAVTALAALIAKGKPPAPQPAPARPLVVAGTVVDAADNRGLGHASLQIEGVAEGTASDDAGNFRLACPAGADPQRRVLLRGSKAGYRPVERWIAPPVDSVILPLVHE